MQRIIKSIYLPDIAASLSAGAEFAPLLRAGDIVLLRGNLGAGKTSFSRGVISGLCGQTEVPSPTYTFVQTYNAPDFDIWHFDLYRLQSQSQVWELGLEEAFDGVCLIEWPERIEGLLSGGELEIKIDFAEKGRKLTYVGNQNWRERFGA